MCEGERGQPCARVCGSILLYAFEHMCSLHACVCENHHCHGGGEALALSPGTDWCFLLWSAGCVCAVWNKDLAAGEYPGDRHLHKTPSHTMSSSSLSTHMSVSQMHLLKLHAVMCTLITGTQSTSTINS